MHFFGRVYSMCACVLALLVSVDVYATDACTEILRQGVYDTLNEESGTALASQQRAMLCTEDSAESEKSRSGAIGGSYGGFGASVASSRANRNAYKKAMCSDNASEEDLRAFARLVKAEASEVVANSWTKCEEMNAKGVRAELTQDIGAASIGAYVSGASADVMGYDITPSNIADQVSCTGSLSKATEDQPVRLLSTFQYLSCKGPVKGDADGRPTSAPGFTINLKTSQGELQYFARSFVRDVTSEEAKHLMNAINQRTEILSSAVLAVEGVDCPQGWESYSAAAGRTIVGAGSGAGLSARVAGKVGGEEDHLLTVAEMPEHTHAGEVSTGAGISAAHIANVPGQLTLNRRRIGGAGGSRPHNNMPPFIVMTLCKRSVQ